MSLWRGSDNAELLQAIRSDILNFLESFILERTTDFGAFKKFWKLKNFSAIHHSSPKLCDPVLFTQAMYSVAVSLLFENPKRSLEQSEERRLCGDIRWNFGALYFLHCLWGTQLHSPKLPIRVDMHAAGALLFTAKIAKLVHKWGYDAANVLASLVRAKAFVMCLYTGGPSLCRLYSQSEELCAQYIDKSKANLVEIFCIFQRCQRCIESIERQFTVSQISHPEPCVQVREEQVSSRLLHPTNEQLSPFVLSEQSSSRDMTIAAINKAMLSGRQNQPVQVAPKRARTNDLSLLDGLELPGLSIVDETTPLHTQAPSVPVCALNCENDQDEANRGNDDTNVDHTTIFPPVESEAPNNEERRPLNMEEILLTIESARETVEKSRKRRGVWSETQPSVQDSASSVTARNRKRKSSRGSGTQSTTASTHCTLGVSEPVLNTSRLHKRNPPDSGSVSEPCESSRLSGLQEIEALLASARNTVEQSRRRRIGDDYSSGIAGGNLSEIGSGSNTRYANSSAAQASNAPRRPRKRKSPPKEGHRPAFWSGASRPDLSSVQGIEQLLASAKSVAERSRALRTSQRSSGPQASETMPDTIHTPAHTSDKLHGASRVSRKTAPRPRNSKPIGSKNSRTEMPLASVGDQSNHSGGGSAQSELNDFATTNSGQSDAHKLRPHPRNPKSRGTRTSRTAESSTVATAQNSDGLERQSTGASPKDSNTMDMNVSRLPILRQNTNRPRKPKPDKVPRAGVPANSDVDKEKESTDMSLEELMDFARTDDRNRARSEQDLEGVSADASPTPVRTFEATQVARKPQPVTHTRRMDLAPADDLFGSTCDADAHEESNDTLVAAFAERSSLQEIESLLMSARETVDQSRKRRIG